MSNGMDFSLDGLKASLSGRKIKDAKKEVIFSEFYALLSSGLDFSRSFKMLIEGETDEHVKAVLKKLYDKVIKGTSLWSALEGSGCFSALDCGVIRIGEETGRLHESLKFITEYYHKKIEQKRMVSSAVSYPVIILCIAVVVVIFMLMVIVPMFEQVYARMGNELPAMTRGIIAISKHVPAVVTVAGVLILLGSVALYVLRDNDAVRAAKASFLLKFPVVGNIVKKKTQSHFCKLLYLLTSSGIPLVTGIGMLRSIITLYPYQASFGDMCTGLRRGEAFSSNLDKHGDLYDKKLITLLRVGEETNRLPDMFLRQSDDLAVELEYKLRQLSSMLEPALILLVGCLVSVILVSMYMPMFKLGSMMF